MFLSSFLNPRFFVVVGLILAAAVYRLIPYEPMLGGLPYFWNFAPVGAIALFAGAAISSRLLAFVIPLTVLLISDILIGNATGTDTFYPGFWVNYASFAIYVVIGFRLRNGQRGIPVRCAALDGSLQFFVLSNFGVWAFADLYPRTLAGLSECFVKAIPFFGGTLLSDQLFTFVLFGVLAVCEWSFPRLRQPVLQPA